MPDATYLGVVEPEWKERKRNHKSDFKLPHRRIATCLSEYIWSLKDKGLEEDKDWTVTWALMARAPSFSPTTGCCRLCLKEKSLMVLKPEWATLNNRNEFFATCRHKTKLLLSSVK